MSPITVRHMIMCVLVIPPCVSKKGVQPPRGLQSEGGSRFAKEKQKVMCAH